MLSEPVSRRQSNAPAQRRPSPPPARQPSLRLQAPIGNAQTPSRTRRPNTTPETLPRGPRTPKGMRSAAFAGDHESDLCPRAHALRRKGRSKSLIRERTGAEPLGSVATTRPWSGPVRSACPPMPKTSPPLAGRPRRTPARARAAHCEKRDEEDRAERSHHVLVKSRRPGLSPAWAGKGYQDRRPAGMPCN